MKRINEFKKQFDVTPETTLASLKKTYRTLIKEWHPDKFRDDDEKAAEAEANSTKIIEAYHFLVSISPETQAANLEEYTTTTTSTGIDDFILEKQVLKVTFKDGSAYEYYGVPNKVYLKMINAATQYRFGKRHIFNSYTYRQVQKRTEEA
jgi:curved DNA-binding protein CbpA